MKKRKKKKMKTGTYPLLRFKEFLRNIEEITKYYIAW